MAGRHTDRVLKKLRDAHRASEVTLSGHCSHCESRTCADPQRRAVRLKLLHDPATPSSVLEESELSTRLNDCQVPVTLCSEPPVHSNER